MPIFTRYNNADAAIINLLRKLNIDINPQDVIAELEKHPDYPSLLAVSDVLNWFRVDNAAYRVTADELADVPVPFIASTKQNGDFVTVSKITASHITLTDHTRTNYTLPIAEFNKTYNGIVLSAEAPETQTDAFKQSFIDRLAVYKSLAAVAGLAVVFTCILFFYTGYLTHITWQIGLITLFKTAGLVTSVLLLIQSIDKNNPLVQTLCGGAGKTDCNAILTSKAATVPTFIGIKGLTWSEVGFFYFAGTWLALLFGGGSVALLQVLAILNIISLPYTVYSINYQARIAKQWCLFCTVVQGLLWLEFIPLMATFTKPSLPGRNWEELATLFICLVLPIIIWQLLKPLFLKQQQLQPLKLQLRKFKYNIDFFNKVLVEQPKYALPDEEWCILLGNVEANHIITLVTNPYCEPCARMHALLDELLAKNGNLQARIVLSIKDTEIESKTSVGHLLMALNSLEDKCKVREALHNWYGRKQKNYEAWAKNYPMELSVGEYDKIDKQNAWCQMAEITGTPTLMLNGYRLPNLYQLQDLKYMLE
jgi:predicted double-glycine peptidase/uncharacterized membrane protein